MLSHAKNYKNIPQRASLVTEESSTGMVEVKGGCLDVDNHLTFLDPGPAHFLTFKGPTPIISDTLADTLAHHFPGRK